MMIKRNNR